MLFGGSVFGVFSGFYYWTPKIWGRMLDEGLGKVHFWLMLIGFNLTFFPMHIVGLTGMPRRIFTYASGQGWDTMNLLATIGAFLIASSIMVFLINFFRSMKSGEIATDNPWGGSTLEWATSSPPPPYNFKHIPIITGRDPLWADNPPNGKAKSETH